MFPTIIEIGPIKLHTYGLMVALGFYLAFRYIHKNAIKRNIQEKKIIDLALYTMITGLIAARITYVILNFSYYFKKPLDVLKIWQGGLVFYGGFIAGVIFVLLYVRLNEDLDLWVLADIIAPAIVLGHFFGRLGCFFAGCCYGIPTNVAWAVKFTDSQSLAPLNIELHPTQLYEAAGNLIIFLFLAYYNKTEHTKGKTFIYYLFSYSTLRFIVEYFRGDERGFFILGFSFSQAIAFILFAIAAVLFIKRRNA